MKLGMMFASLVAVLGVSAIGCSIESTSSGSGGKTGPVASTPLSGTIEGKSFAGKFGRAKRSGFGEEGDTERMIDIFDTEVPCNSFSDTPQKYVLLSVPWKAGTTRDFKLGGGEDSQTATFVVEQDGKTRNIVSTQGRVEILEAPTEAGAKGKIRVRAIADANNVEGEVTVKVCE